MASTHIEIQATASRLSALVRSTVDMGRTFQENVTQARDIMVQVVTGSDWAALATKLGCTAAEAEAVYTLFTALYGALDAAVFNNVLDRLG